MIGNDAGSTEIFGPVTIYGQTTIVGSPFACETQCSFENGLMSTTGRIDIGETTQSDFVLTRPDKATLGAVGADLTIRAGYGLAGYGSLKLGGTNGSDKVNSVSAAVLCMKIVLIVFFICWQVIIESILQTRIDSNTQLSLGTVSGSVSIGRVSTTAAVVGSVCPKVSAFLSSEFLIRILLSQLSIGESLVANSVIASAASKNLVLNPATSVLELGLSSSSLPFYVTRPESSGASAGDTFIRGQNAPATFLSGSLFVSNSFLFSLLRFVLFFFMSVHSFLSPDTWMPDPVLVLLESYIWAP